MIDLMELRTFVTLPQELCCDLIHELHTNRLEKLSMPSSFVSLSNREAARFSMNEAFLISSNARVSCLRGHMRTETTNRILVNLLHHTLSLYYFLSRDPVKTDGRVDLFPMNILNQNRLRLFFALNRVDSIQCWSPGFLMMQPNVPHEKSEANVYRWAHNGWLSLYSHGSQLQNYSLCIIS